MPSCLKASLIGEAYTDYVLNDAGTARAVPLTAAKVLVPDVVTTDLGKCAAVAVSGAEWQSLTGRISALESRPVSSGGGGEVSVSADIFVGAALVLCLAVGWIAGAQR